MKKLLIGCMAAIAALIALSGCDQDKVLYNGSSYLMFSDTLYTYAVQETNEIFNVPVSATKSVDYDRTLAVEVIDKESNAVEGKHYRILSNTVTIKAGEMSTNVEVEGIYKNIGISDSLGFALRLVIPETEQWSMYGTEAKVVMQKVCPFDIKNFTGYCKVTSTYLSSDYYPKNVDLRLVTSDVVEGKENTVVMTSTLTATIWKSPSIGMISCNRSSKWKSKFVERQVRLSTPFTVTTNCGLINLPLILLFIVLMRTLSSNMSQ